MCGGVPSDEIGGEALLVEAPELPVGEGAHLHAVAAGGEAGLDDAVAVDEDLPRQRVDLERVPHVRLEQLEDGVHRAQLPVRRDDERLHARVRPQPARTGSASIDGGGQF